MNAVVIGKINFPEGMAGTKRVRHFVEYLNSHGISTKIISLFKCKENYYTDEKFDLSGICYKKIGKEINLKISQLINIPIIVFAFICTIKKWKDPEKKNVIIIYGEPSVENLLFALISKTLKYKLVYDIVEDYELFLEKVNLKTKLKIKSTAFLNNFMFFYADGVTVITKHLEQKYNSKSKNRYPVKLIPISASINNCTSKGRSNNEFKLVYSGSFAKKDGVEVLVEAVENVSKIQKNITLYLTGEPPDAIRENIERHCSKNTHIKLLGYLEDKEYYKFISRADVLCMTRLDSKFANAGFPFKLGEYLATGKPVIASDVSDVSLYLRDQIDVVLIKPGDVQNVEDAILFLFNDRKKAREIGTNGREACARHFNPETNGRILHEFLGKI